jgi:hypothetical protein
MISRLRELSFQRNVEKYSHDMPPEGLAIWPSLPGDSKYSPGGACRSVRYLT